MLWNFYNHKIKFPSAPPVWQQTGSLRNFHSIHSQYAPLPRLEAWAPRSLDFKHKEQMLIVHEWARDTKTTDPKSCRFGRVVSYTDRQLTGDLRYPCVHKLPCQPVARTQDVRSRQPTSRLSNARPVTRQNTAGENLHRI